MKIILKKTRKKGKGVFANQNFKKGQIILHHDKSKLKKIDKKDLHKVPKSKQNHLDYVGNNKYIVDFSSFSYINHSCNPNCYVKYKNTTVIDVIALRNIKKGEEINYDYSIDASDPWKMKCQCGSKNCRKIVYGDYFKLPKKLQKKYWKYVPKWKKKQCQ